MTRRLLASYLGLTLLLLAVLMIPLGISHARAERRDLLNRIEHDAAALATVAESTADDGAGSALLRRQVAAYQRDFGGRAVVVDRTGRAIADSGRQAAPEDLGSRPEIDAALGGAVARGERRSATLGRDILYVAVPVLAGGRVRGAVRVTYPATPLSDNVRRYWVALAAIAGLVLAGATALAVAMARWIARPLDRVRAAAVAAGHDLAARAPTDDGPPEVRQLGAAINETVAKLEEIVRSREAFVADASHQLRTPLAALRLRLDELEHDISPGGRDDLDAATREVERLGGLVDALLSLARADVTTGRPVPVDVGAIAVERAGTWAPLAAEQGIRISAPPADGTWATATPGHLEQVLDNLLSNAVRAAPAGTAIDVRVVSGPVIEVHVVDRGPGLSEADRTRAFERFWRRQSRGPGTGLGLAIARRLAAVDGGEVELLAAEEGGTDAVVRLRAAAPPTGRSPAGPP